MVIYNGPTGGPVQNPTLEFLYDIVFNQNADYWAKGSGDSAIEIEGIDERLIFFFDEPYGFLLMRHPDYLVPSNSNRVIKVVEHRIGGEMMRFPSCSYLSREKAYAVIAEFVRDHQFSTEIDWIDMYEIDFDHGY